MADVSPEYQANYGIGQTRDTIIQDFITLQAKKKIGENPEPALFGRLSTNFALLFPKLPQKNTYRVSFEQCQLLANKLSVAYANLTFDSFMDQCYGPLNNIMKDVANNYTVKANIKASPASWPAPMTVTFDARASMDPSQDTIPTNNFFWYFKDAQWADIMIGKWSVVKYTFEEEGNYQIHLTARSANNSNEGILDGEATTTVNIAPESSLLVVYANGKKLQNKIYTKIGTQEAQRWVILDGSASQPRGGRSILSHHWEIQGVNGFRYMSEEFQGNPQSVNVPLPSNGSYTITLVTLDNENNTMRKSFLIAVSDPIAIIKQSPENASTSTIVRFDGSPSYALQSRLTRYTWELFDDQGEKIFTRQSKDFSRQFTKPGTYTVKLTVTDELGQSNQESKIVFIDSTDPQAQFTITPRLDREQPSQFVLDASPSFDRDVSNNFDVLSYAWSFSNSSQVKIEQSYDNDKSIVVSMSDPGTYKATLVVSDSYGKIATVTKDIKVTSSLRPIIYAAPRASRRGTPITFAVTSNTDIINYERDFGDGQKSTLQTKNIRHVYNRVGNYRVTLRVTGTRGQTNTISTQIFIGEKDKPVGAYLITNNNQNILKPIESCIGVDGNVAAYPIKRLERFGINTADSVNSKGEKSNLVFFFQPIDDEIYKSSSFSYQFKRLGCQYIDIVVEDSVTTKSDRQRVWFKVTNDLPTLNSLSLFFPQFGNEIGIGFNQNTDKKAFDPTINPLIVKVVAQTPRDNDGFITKYLWYYYKTDDPTRILEYKAWYPNTPSQFFSIMSEPGELTFGVKMTDNDGGEITSEQIIGQWPVIFIPPNGDKNMDIPIVTLAVDKINVAVGDTVTFTTKARILSGRPDFDAKKTVQYDFDGDGVRDRTTKDDSVTYQYTKAFPEGVSPRVQVTYRGFPVSTNGDTIIVKDELKPRIEVVQYDRMVILRDYSYGKIVSKSVCFEAGIQCKYPVQTFSWISQSYSYPDYGSKVILFSVTDAYGNEDHIRQSITLTPATLSTTPTILSIPQGTVRNGAYHIPVGSQSNNTVIFNLISSAKSCFIDKDISEDSNSDGKSNNDRDLSCNEPVTVVYQPLLSTITARVNYDNKISDIIIDFIDHDINLTATQDAQYKQVTRLINLLPNTNQELSDLKAMLNTLRMDIVNNRDTTDSVIQIGAFIDENATAIGATNKTAIDAVLKELADGDAVAAMGGNAYDQAKATILSYASANFKWSVIEQFSLIEQLEEPAKAPDKLKEYLQNILDIFQDNGVPDGVINEPGNESKIPESDIQVTIMPEICRVLNFYEVVSDQCRAEEEEAPSSSLDSLSSGSSSTLVTILKWAGIIVGILAGIFLLIVGFFAIKAKMQQEEEEEEGQIKEQNG